MRRHSGNIHSIRSRFFSWRVAWRYRSYFRLCSSAIDLALEMLFEARVGSTEERKQIAAALFARAIETTQSCLTLAQLGLHNDSAVSVRVIFENFVYLKGVCGNSEFVARYLGADATEQLKLFRRALDLPEELLQDRSLLEAHAAGLEAYVREVGAKRLNLADFAKEVGLDQEYTLVYRQTSPQVHAAARALKRYVSRIRDGEIAEMKFGLDATSVPLNVFTVTEYLLRAAAEFGSLVEVDRREAWSGLYERLRELRPSEVPE